MRKFLFGYDIVCISSHQNLTLLHQNSEKDIKPKTSWLTFCYKWMSKVEICYFGQNGHLFRNFLVSNCVSKAFSKTTSMIIISLSKYRIKGLVWYDQYDVWKSHKMYKKWETRWWMDRKCGQKMMMLLYELDEFYSFFDCLIWFEIHTKWRRMWF